MHECFWIAKHLWERFGGQSGSWYPASHMYWPYARSHRDRPVPLPCGTPTAASRAKLTHCDGVLAHTRWPGRTPARLEQCPGPEAR